MRADRGFTLIETMVALALTAALLSVVYSSLWVGLNSTRRVAGTITENDIVRTFNYFLRNQLRQVDSQSGDKLPAISGERDFMRFRVRHLRGDPAARTFEVKLVAGEEQGMELGIREVGEPERAAPLSAVLLDNLSSLAFSYFGTVDDAPGATWHDSWHSAERPPQMVRLIYRQIANPSRELYLAVSGAGGQPADVND